VDVELASSFMAGGMATMRRVAGDKSEFSRPAARALEELDPVFMSEAVPYVAGGLRALRNAVASGYLVSLQELVHAEVFGDFLKMAGYLLEEGYKDPAAVLTGGVLEGHLRKICVKHELPIDVPDKRGVPRPKKAESMNADLGRKPVYSKLDQKSVTAWLDLRNKAAHGHYDEYTHQQVELMLQGVTDFLRRHPA
ncbi:MAG: hypothetical protein CEE40_06055, partial [Chloroflexi bacterium B3_Chlor]